MNSKQRAFLRARANGLDTILQVGKSEIGVDMIASVKDALEARELIKCNVLQNSEYTARQAAEELAQATGADVVQTIGSRFVLYKESENHKQITLP